MKCIRICRNQYAEHEKSQISMFCNYNLLLHERVSVNMGCIKPVEPINFLMRVLKHLLRKNQTKVNILRNLVGLFGAMQYLHKLQNINTKSKRVKKFTKLTDTICGQLLCNWENFWNLSFESSFKVPLYDFIRITKMCCIMQ